MPLHDMIGCDDMGKEIARLRAERDWLELEFRKRGEEIARLRAEGRALREAILAAVLGLECNVNRKKALAIAEALRAALADIDAPSLGGKIVRAAREE